MIGLAIVLAATNLALIGIWYELNRIAQALEIQSMLLRSLLLNQVKKDL